MNRKGVLLIGIFLFSYFIISFCSAQSSSARTEFTIIGCAGGIPVGTCTGDYYCDIFGVSRNTRIPNYKCIYYSGCCSDSYKCACPDGGMSCSPDSMRCILRDVECIDINSPTECENANCIWMNGECFDPTFFNSCSSYTNRSVCLQDPRNLGKTGIGSEYCRGGVFVGADKVVVPDSCRCVWNSSSSKCEIGYNITNRGTTENPGFFECRKDISVSSCLNGFQNMSWKAVVASKSPPSYTPTQQELSDAGCFDSSKMIPCGEEISLLPGFSLLNILLVAGLLFAFYFLRNKNSKKLFFLGLFFAVFFSNFALAEICEPSQQIFRLYQANNSHVQLPIFGEEYGVHNCTQVWPDSSINCSQLNESMCVQANNSAGQKICQWISSSNQIYNYDVCYNYIFGDNYTGSDPHPATCSKPLFWVAKITNSHASLKRIYTYDIPVCYGDLECTNKSYILQPGAGCNVAEGEKPIARMYSASNYTNAHLSIDYSGSIYGEVICCKRGGINISYWSDFYGAEISEANNQQTVKMAVFGRGLENQWINYTVYKDVPLRWDRRIAQSSTYGSAPLNLRNFEPGRYYFKARIGSGREISSGYLQVVECNSSREECNVEPNITILSPACGASFFNGSNVSVRIRIDDPDDIIEGTLSFSDGEIISVSNLNSDMSGGLSYIHSFGTPGIVKIVLDVNGTSRGVERRFRRSINVIVINTSAEASYVAACIKEPEDLSFIPSSWVHFNAQTTKALSFIPGSPSAQDIPKDRIYFKWMLSDTEEVEGCGSDPSVYSFNHQFADSGNNWADLEASLGGCE